MDPSTGTLAEDLITTATLYKTSMIEVSKEKVFKEEDSKKKLPRKKLSGKRLQQRKQLSTRTVVKVQQSFELVSPFSEQQLVRGRIHIA